MKARSNYPQDAATWDARLRAPDITDAEKVAFEKWCLQSPENQQAFDDLQSLLHALSEAQQGPEILALREAARDYSAPAGQRWLQVWLPRVAALIVVCLAGLAYLVPSNVSTTKKALTPSFETAVGERSTANLEDGSIMVLNTDTVVDVAFSPVQRLVTLQRGQALFEVAKDTSRPFVVVAGEQRITAIGTIFDVRLTEHKVLVTLVEGIVEVQPETSPNALLTSEAAAASPIRMRPGEQLITPVVSTSAPPTMQRADVEHATIWREGRIFFDDVPLSTAITEMNRYSTTQIHLDGSTTANYRVSGMFRTGRQHTFVNAIEAYYPLAAQGDAEGRIVLATGPPS